MSRRACLVVNPRSGAGATGRRVDEIRAAATRHLGPCELWLTERPGHGTELARRAVTEGFDLVVAVGGDGTANEVVNGLFDQGEPLAPQIVFGIVHGGTGGDLVKTLHVPADLDAAFGLLKDVQPVLTDVLDVHLRHGSTGEAVRRCSINVTGFGMNGVVVQRANQSSKRWGGRATFLGATARTILDYRPVETTISWVDAEGGEGSWTGPLSSAFVANGQFCGGGMWVGRGGSMQDGLVDLTIIPELPLPRLVLGSPRLFSGTIDRVKGVSRIAVRSIEAFAASGTTVLVDVDGEQPGVLPLRARVLPSVLLVAGKW